MTDVEQVFTGIYRHNSWNDAESVSGPGSRRAQTRHLQSELPLLLKELKVRTLLDIPCGDFNWMKEVDLEGVNYIGGDIVGQLIERNSQLWTNERRSFVQIDLMTSQLPRADLVFCRDCLGHLPVEAIYAALRNICASGAEYLLTTHFTYRSLDANRDILTGDWRRLNLEIPPFCFPPPKRMIVEGCSEGGGCFADKSMSLWPVGQISSLVG